MSKLKTFNAILMITGTSVGTGILGLPIVTSSAGLIPTFVAFIVAWIFMTVAAFHILDVKMQVKGHYNLSSMIKLTMGRTGQYCSSIIILLLLYALLCTYMMAGSAWLSVLLAPVITLPGPLMTLLFTFLFATIIFFGDGFIYSMNNALAICLIIAFVVTVGMSLSPLHEEFITQRNFSAILPSLPLLLTTFGFSIVVPAVTEYLDYNKKSATFAIMLGGMVALAAYAVWEWVTLSHIPLQGPMSFHTLKQTGDNGTGVILAFASSVNSHMVNVSGRIFAIFAAITSFLGVSLALIHFLADVLNRQAVGSKRFVLSLATFIPPLLITSLVPNAFVQVLSFAGLFVAILLGLFPVLMVYKSQNKNGRLCGHVMKKLMMTCTGLFFVYVIFQEIRNLSGL
ncbi:MAG: aromatic amino acid transport family protein [Legionellaceae bacterium]|nr:aromatic amino acid transport family protein [Legionellaceae bacterium]